MYIITSNTSSDIAFDVVQNGESKIIHLNKKFSTAISEIITDRINYLDNRGIIKCVEVQSATQVQSNTVENTKETHHRGRRSQSAEQNTEEVKSDNSNSDESKSDEGGK